MMEYIYKLDIYIMYKINVVCRNSSEESWLKFNLGFGISTISKNIAFVERKDSFAAFQDYLVQNRELTLNTDFNSLKEIRNYIKKGDDERYSIDHAIDLKIEGKLYSNYF